MSTPVKELHLVHTIRTPRGENWNVLREANGTAWERQANGDYLLTLTGDLVHEYLVPAASVKFERRPRAEKKK